MEEDEDKKLAESLEGKAEELQSIMKVPVMRYTALTLCPPKTGTF